MENKKAQAWGFDLIAGLVIFLVGILSFYLYTINLPSQGQEIVQRLQEEADIVADGLMSEGSPEDWTLSRVERIGLLSDDRINESKLESFRDMDYGLTKSLFRISNDYYVYFEGNYSEGVGLESNGAENLVKVTRAVVYDDSITTLNVHVWK